MCFDAHETDVHPLNQLEDVDNVDVNNELLKARVNPISDISMNDLSNLKSKGFIKWDKQGIELANGDVGNFIKMYLRFGEYNDLYNKIRSFVLRSTRGDYRIRANYLSKKSLTHGETAYLVRKNTLAVNTIRALLATLIPALDALINSEAADKLIEHVTSAVAKVNNPFYREAYPNFLERACRNKIYPIRVSGRCTDIREEQGKTVLYVEGSGAVRIYTRKECFTITLPDLLRDKLVTVDGLPFRNSGVPVMVALKIIERKPFSLREVLV